MNGSDGASLWVDQLVYGRSASAEERAADQGVDLLGASLTVELPAELWDLLKLRTSGSAECPAGNLFYARVGPDRAVLINRRMIRVNQRLSSEAHVLLGSAAALTVSRALALWDWPLPDASAVAAEGQLRMLDLGAYPASSDDVPTPTPEQTGRISLLLLARLCHPERGLAVIAPIEDRRVLLRGLVDALGDGALAEGFSAFELELKPGQTTLPPFVFAKNISSSPGAKNGRVEVRFQVPASVAGADLAWAAERLIAIRRERRGEGGEHGDGALLGTQAAQHLGYDEAVRLDGILRALTQCIGPVPAWLPPGAAHQSRSRTADPGMQPGDTGGRNRVLEEQLAEAERGIAAALESLREERSGDVPALARAADRYADAVEARARLIGRPDLVFEELGVDRTVLESAGSEGRSIIESLERSSWHNAYSDRIVEGRVLAAPAGPVVAQDRAKEAATADSSVSPVNPVARPGEAKTVAESGQGADRLASVRPSAEQWTHRNRIAPGPVRPPASGIDYTKQEPRTGPVKRVLIALVFFALVALLGVILAMAFGTAT